MARASSRGKESPDPGPPPPWGLPINDIGSHQSNFLAVSMTSPAPSSPVLPALTAAVTVFGLIACFALGSCRTQARDARRGRRDRQTTAMVGRLTNDVGYVGWHDARVSGAIVPVWLRDLGGLLRDWGAEGGLGVILAGMGVKWLRGQRARLRGGKEQA